MANRLIIANVPFYSTLGGRLQIRPQRERDSNLESRGRRSRRAASPARRDLTHPHSTGYQKIFGWVQ